jgi:hypothetical protein
MQSAVRFLYAIAVATFLVLAIAFGILTFYPSPEAPQYPAALVVPASKSGAPVPAEATPTAAQQAYEQQYQAYQSDRADHHRNVLLIATLLAAVAIVAGIAAAGALDVLRVGLMLGGLFTVLWALVYAGGEASTGVLFVAALLVLGILVALSQARARAWLGRTLRLGEGDDLLGR